MGKVESLTKENAILQKTYDRLTTQYQDDSNIQKQADKLMERIRENREIIKNAMLEGTDEFSYSTNKRGVGN